MGLADEVAVLVRRHFASEILECFIFILGHHFMTSLGRFLGLDIK
jgi:hypothetical protein